MAAKDVKFGGDARARMIRGVETLAEGVESAGEHSLLAQLGCDHVQGLGIARPMAADQLAAWVREHDAKPGQARWPSQDAG